MTWPETSLESQIWRCCLAARRKPAKKRHGTKFRADFCVKTQRSGSGGHWWVTLEWDFTKKCWTLNGNRFFFHRFWWTLTTFNSGNIHGETMGWNGVAIGDERRLLGGFLSGQTNWWKLMKRSVFTLVGGLEHDLYFSIQLGIEAPTDFHSIIFSEGFWYTTNQIINHHFPSLITINHH